MSQTVELKKKETEGSELISVARISPFVKEVFELTSQSIDPLMKRSQLDRDIFMAGVATEFSAAFDRQKSDMKPLIRQQARSLVAAVAHQAASLGLYLGIGPTGRMASIVFRGVYSKQGAIWTTTGVSVAVQPEWRGVIHLIRRANPDIVDIKIGLVGPRDEFEVDELNDVVAVHRTRTGDEPCEPKVSLLKTGFVLEDIVAAYALVTFSGGRRRVVRLTRADFIRSISASETMKLPYKDKEDNRPTSPWVLHTKPMCYKTVAHALFRKPDVWAAGGGMDFQALESLKLASTIIDEVDGNRIVPPEKRDKRVDALLELAAEFGGTDSTLTAAAKQLGFDDPALAVAAGRFTDLASCVREALRAPRA